MNRFEIVIVSDEVGCSKPEKKIFLHACKRAGEQPGQCVYIGDKLDVDALAGRKAGLNSIWLNRGRVRKNSQGVPEINGLNELSKEVLNVAPNPANRRKSARTYPSIPLRIAILEKRFQIDNISNEGMGIAVDGPDVFFIGQRIDAIVFEGEDPENPISGVVSHISKDKHGFLCGIRFVFNDSRDFNYVKGLTLKLHKQYGNA